MKITVRQSMDGCHPRNIEGGSLRLRGIEIRCFNGYLEINRQRSTQRNVGLMVVLEELFSSQTIEEPAGECGECTVHHASKPAA